VPGVVPAVVGVPVTRAAGWLEAAGLSLVQRLRVDEAAAPGTVLAQAPAGGAARAAGAPVELTVAVDGQGAGGLGVTLVPEVLGQPEAAAPPAALGGRVGRRGPGRLRRRPGPRRRARPGLALRPCPGRPGPHRHPGPPVGQPPGCPPLTTTTTRPGPSTTSRAER